jgi:hypothetical protein
MPSTTRKSARVGANGSKDSRRNTGRTSATSEHKPMPKEKQAKPTADLPGKGKFVHAYRRERNMVMRNEKLVEEPVEVILFGERIRFQANEHGHIVAEVRTPDAYDRLVKEIPEAYIPYEGGQNVPDKLTADELDAKNQVPQGKYVLTNGAKSVVLDKMPDAKVREFAKAAGLTDDQLPDVLTGETLQLAVYNLITGG